MPRDGTVLVTGSAGAIGGAAAARFAGMGWTVLGIDRSPSTLVTERYSHIEVDLTDAVGTIDAIAAELRHLPPLRHTIGVAGGALAFEPGTRDTPESIAVDDFRQSLDANLTTQFVVVQSSIRHAGGASGDRSITLTSSFNAFTAQGMPAYSAAKAGLIGLMRALVQPLGGRGMRINVVAPGTVRTPRTERLWSSDAEHFTRLQAGTALGRIASPDDIADAYVALAVHLRHVTGQVLVVDGGQSVLHR